jgi:hypothetical protein
MWWSQKGKQWRTQEFCSGVEGFNKFRWGQRAVRRGSGGGSPLVRVSVQFANVWNPYSYYVFMYVFSTEQGIRLGFFKISEGGGLNPQTPLGTPLRESVAWNSVGGNGGISTLENGMYFFVWMSVDPQYNRSIRRQSKVSTIRHYPQHQQCCT